MGLNGCSKYFFSSYYFASFCNITSLERETSCIFQNNIMPHYLFCIFSYCISFFERKIEEIAEIALYTIFTAYAYYIIHWWGKSWTHFWNKVLLFSVTCVILVRWQTLNSILFATFNTHALSSSTGPSGIMNDCGLPCKHGYTSFGL